jgi:acyl-CoA reductase-like NAD-dependent aldehyde dehydrogenase
LLEYRDVYAGGRLIPSVSPDVITVVNPATEEIAGTVPASAAADVDASVGAARRAFDDGGWALGPRADRADAMERLASALDDRAEDTARLVTAETGMPIRFSRIHNGMAPSAILRYYASLARGLAPEEFRGAISFPGQTLVRREPVGVTAVLAPWNYPLTLAFAQLAPALAVGCTAVLKPATETSLSAYILAEAFEAADFPLGVFNMVTGGHDVAEMLARHRGIDKVAFAGVVSAGRRIAAICGERLKPVSLELGGTAAAILLADADLSAATAELGGLCFANSGQACFAASRVLAPRSRYDEAVSALAQQAAGMMLGDPMDEETTMGPLIGPDHRGRVESYVAGRVAAGARVVTGGRRPAAPVRGYHYEPTVLAGAMPPPGAGEEVFGPVVTVVPYTGEAEAVALANDSECGLAVSVWTADAERGLEMARRSRAGTFGVNLYMPDLGAPWGDRRASGPASLYGPESLDAYVSAKSVFLKG